MRSRTRLAALLVLGGWLSVPWFSTPWIAGPASAAPLPPSAPALPVPAPGDVPVTPEGQLPLVLETTAGGAIALAARVQELGGHVEYSFETMPALAVTVPATRVHELLGDAQVIAVERQKWIHRAVSTVELPGIGRIEDGAFHVVDLAAKTFPVSRGELRRGGGSELATFLGYDAMIGATEVWEDADFGEGAIVVVVDTGVFPDHPLIAGSVIGGENLVPAEDEERIDHDHDGTPDGRSFDWNAIQNHDHGTFVSGLIAGHADLVMPLESQLAQSLLIHSPESIDSVDVTMGRVSLMGMAPAASIYAMKVFPYDGGSAPDARVAAALDRVIEMKRSGELAVDVVNMSLGGPTLWDGRSVLDRMVDAAVAEGITVVVAAGNEGPALVTTGSPANAFRALAVGGAVDPIHTRVGIEQLFEGAPIGVGQLIYPYDAVQVANFSSRGLTGDGRVKPDLLATGLLSFSSALFDVDMDGLNDVPGYAFGVGTSFATPTVAGAAALLAAYGRSIGGLSEAPYLANVLMSQARPIADWRRVPEVEQGKGFVRLPEAFAMLQNGHGQNPPPRSTRNDAVTYLDAGEHGIVSGRTRALGPGETHTFVIEVPWSVKSFDVSVPEVTLGSEQNPIIGDHLEIHVHSAKRGGNGDYLFVDPDVSPFAGFTTHRPEWGQIRVTFAGSLTNWGRAEARFTLKTKSGSTPGVLRAEAALGNEGVWETSVDVPEDLAGVEFWLSWDHDWRTLPTYDLDLLAIAPDGTPHLGGLSLRSPEHTMIIHPMPGTWQLRVMDMDTIRGSEWFRVHWKTHRFFDPDVYEKDEGGGEVEVGGREVAAAPVDAAAAGAPQAGLLTVGRPALAFLGVTPNPARPEASIRFEIGNEGGGEVRVVIFDLSGRRVRTLLERSLEPGVHTAEWDGRGDDGAIVASGVYFARIEAPAGTATRKLVVAR